MGFLVGQKATTKKDFVWHRESLPVNGGIILCCNSTWFFIQNLKPEITHFYPKNISRFREEYSLNQFIENFDSFMTKPAFWYSDNELLSLIETKVIIPDGSEYAETISEEAKIGDLLLLNEKYFQIVEKTMDNKTVWVE